MLVDYPEAGYAKAYIGLAPIGDEKGAANEIADWGAKLSAEVARALWPQGDRRVDL